jgi:Tat protein secretion system quality control protein TatD with DNase activity
VLGEPLDRSLLELTRAVGPAPLDCGVHVRGAVAVYCDPETYPSLDTIAKSKQQNVYSVVGVHPKKLGQFNPGARRALRDLWRSGELVGFGEFGLDRTTPTTDHIPQEDVVRELLEFLPSEGVIVLHVRGRDDDRLAEEPLHRLLWLLQEGRLSRSRRIHLHC